MPYIRQIDRLKWKRTIEDVTEALAGLPADQVDGEVNFLVTSILKRVYTPKYFNFNRAIGVLECIKQEFYRKVIGPYEDTKIVDNGDVE